MYNEFCELFENHIERIIKEVSPNASGEDLFRCLKGMGDDGSFTVELLLSVTDYNNFVEMMKHYKREQAAKAQE